MANSITYSRAKAELALLCDQVIATREPVIIRRDSADDVALLPADELSGLLETIHLLRSPRNAQRLFTALDRARTEECPPSSVEDLRRQL